jgi:WS/DGAT/MGAT family acyltransferase
MPVARLSALDASFLTAETPTAHMHVGWAALFDPPADGPRPSFEQLCDHVAARLPRAPRYRQRLAPVPFGVHDPVWVDDESFDIAHHVLRAPVADLHATVDIAMSAQMERTRPLWELWIADRLADGRIAVVGKAHHCMVDGLAAVELASLMLDPEPDPPLPPPDSWRPRPAPRQSALLARGLVERTREQIELLRLPARVLTAPREQMRSAAIESRRAASALANSLGTAAPSSRFNQPSSPLRHLGTTSRPLDELRSIKARYDVTINDVVLAVAAGAVRRFLRRKHEPAIRLKAMIPVSVRHTGAHTELGNRISFIFIELPCDEPDAVQRLRYINRVTTERKRSGEPLGADTVLRVAAHTPPWVQHAMTRLVSSPRTFNLVVSNIPGPQQALYMHGCRLLEAYPIVPLAERHALSIGVTTIAGRACFGLYADRKALPDVDRLAEDIDDAIAELLSGRRPDGRRRRRMPQSATPV